MILATQSELQSLGDMGLPGQAHRGTLLLRLVTSYVTDFHEAIEGTLRRDATADELYVVRVVRTGQLILWGLGLAGRGSTIFSMRFMPTLSARSMPPPDCP